MAYVVNIWVMNPKNINLVIGYDQISGEKEWTSRDANKASTDGRPNEKKSHKTATDLVNKSLGTKYKGGSIKYPRITTVALKIVAHGNPTDMNIGRETDITDRNKSSSAREMADQNVEFVGTYLSKAVNFCKPCYIILASCNVGLSKSNWINKLAKASGCTIFAPMGYITYLTNRDIIGGGIQSYTKG